MRPEHAFVSIDGEIVPGERAVLSVFDRGFLYGDSVYEVLRVYGGAPFALGAHLLRLRSSAAAIGLDLPPSDRAIADALAAVLLRAALAEAYVRIVVTRGGGSLGLDPALAESPRLLLYVLPVSPPPPVAYKKGVGALLVSSSDHERDVDARVKSGNYLASVLATSAARRKGAHEALRVHEDGRVSEGASSNVFVVRRGVVTTPPLSGDLLHGVTRVEVIGVARGLGLTVREAHLTARALLRADEVFLTSSIREVLPVTRVLDGRSASKPRSIGGQRIPISVGNGSPGPVTTRLLREFRRHARRAARREWRSFRDPGRFE